MICEKCGIIFTHKHNLNRHLKIDHGEKIGGGVNLIKNALNNKFLTYTITPSQLEQNDVLIFFQQRYFNLLKIITDNIPCKWILNLGVTFFRPLAETVIYNEAFFNTPCQVSLDENNLMDQLQDSLIFFQNSIENFTNLGSGWIFSSINQLNIRICEYYPLLPASYIPTPKKLSNSKCGILNVRNTDNYCFKWSILGSLHKVPHPERPQNYRQWENDLNFQGITFPVGIRHIEKFENLNNISVSVFGYEGELFPIRVSQMDNSRHHVDLLLIKNKTTSHYCLIRNFSALNHRITKHKAKKHYCRFCVLHFNSLKQLDDHVEFCRKKKPQKVSMPSSDEIINFTQVSQMVPMPFSIFFDFESIICPSEGGKSKHEPCAYCYVIIDEEGNFYEHEGKKFHVYLGDDPVMHFLNEIIMLEEKLGQILTNVKPLIMSPENELEYQMATHCGICHEVLNSDKVRDHSHTSGKFRFAAHNGCNLNFTTPKIIPVIAHNLRGYDMHFLMEKLGAIKKDLKIGCIAQNFERYICFSLGKLRFIDSLQFLNSSLETLVNNLVKSKWSFPLMGSLENNENHLSLLLRKGIYCYEYVDSLEKLKETKLPTIENFFSKLTGEGISETDYQHALKVWETFGCKTIGDYTKLYVATDTVLLAEVMNAFRKTCYENFELEALHFVSTPGLSWSAFLKFTDVSIKPLIDIDQHLFIESGMRGGVSSVGNWRYAKANDPRCPDYFDPLQPPSSILYFDKNNLYAKGLSDFLPLGDFRFLSPAEIQHFDLNSIPPLGPKGYILCVDLAYPPHLHEQHGIYPLAPELRNISPDILSDYSNSILNLFQMKPSKNNYKLVTTLYDKLNYVVHFRNLQFYTKKGLIISQIHNILEFTQANYIEPYVSFNTEKRKHTQAESEKDFYKLCNNALYGKTCENLRNRVDISLVKDEKRANKLIKSSTFKDFRIFHHNLVAVQSIKKNIKLDKPIFIGFTVLELSKLYMYEFFYDYMLPKFGDRFNLLLTDTDSFVFHIQSENALQELKNDIKDEFDTSNFPREHFMYSDVNKGVINKMKIEFPDNPILEVVALRAKNYSLKFADNKEKRVAKGVTKAAKEHKLTHEMYKKVLFEKIVRKETMQRIGSKNHEINTIDYEKVCLSPYDDKRFFVGEHGIVSHPYGSIKCNK